MSDYRIEDHRIGFDDVLGSWLIAVAAVAAALFVVLVMPLV